MTGGTGAVKNTPFDSSREQQMRRLRRVIREELTELQRDTLVAYYFQRQSLTQIARDRNVNKSTVCRTLHRAEQKLRKFLKY